MAAGRTLHVKCSTWDQVEVFHTRKLRDGKLLSMKVPFEATIGKPVMLGLELPNGLVIAIDGIVRKTSPIEGDTKTWIEVELVGFTAEIVARIRDMASGISPAAAGKDVLPERPSVRSLSAEDLPRDEKQLFQHLTGELKRMRSAAVHEVLGVDRDADADAVRAAWMALVRRHHPDLVARRKAPAITHVAEELTILVNRAYDRLRAALVSEGRATTVGSMTTAPPGWLVGFDDISSKPDKTPARIGKITPVPAPAPAAPTPHAGDTFEVRARHMLMLGDSDNAQEILAAALVVYPRSRPLRSLYYVASALAALGKGEKMLATSQLETALAHHDQCVEASRLLDHLRRNETADAETLQRLFS